MKASLTQLSKQEQQTLLKCGVPRSVFSYKPFNLDSSVTSFVSEVDGLKPKRLSTNAQHEYIEKVLHNPFHSSYTMCVCGKPNDNLAKTLAALILSRANKHYTQAVRKEQSSRAKVLRQRSLPLWHNVTGSFQDELRDKKQEHKPAMLVLANITKESSNVKKEKVRDLIEVYSSIPVIVVVAGTDPVTFFNEHLMHSLNYGVLLCKANVMKEVQL